MQASQHQMSIKSLLKEFAIDAPDIIITDLVLDSREVAIHKGFVAIKGHQLDGRDFIPQAISLGAKVIITECDTAEAHGHMEMREQSLIVQFYQLPQKLSELASIFYGKPAEKLDVVAVTGTNGKTSTVQLITQLRYLLGNQVASIGTLGAGMYAPQRTDNLSVTVNTTPDAVQMQRLLAEYALNGAAQVALEASSHALVQGRIRDLHTRVAVFTNLTRDHLDYHGTMSEYARAKRLLIEQPGLQSLVLNADDNESQAWLQAADSALNTVLYACGKTPEQLPQQHKFVVAEQVEFHTAGVSFLVNSSWGKAQFEVGLLGQFNVSNMLAAIATQLVQGYSLDMLQTVAKTLKPVAGRMEVYTNNTGANVVVDYAHTPDALEQALKAARHHCKAQLCCVFGCGGDRDQGKRSLMGEIAERLADKLVLTNDNSRSEPPQNIIEDILSGCIQPENINIELDRKAAIKLALSNTSTGDLVLVAGKGHEDYQIIGEQTLPYNEREYVKNLLEGKEQCSL